MEPAVKRGKFYRCESRGLVQVIGCLDLCDSEHNLRLRSILPEAVDLVYSDPPWNPGNEKYWRRHAHASESSGYTAFLNAWHAVVGECIVRGARHVFTEQSENEKHRAMFLDAKPWGLGLLEEWTVFYGTPGSRSVRRPNRLLHFGARPIATDPSGMAGEAMTIRVCAGVGIPPGSTVVDPCIGKGMTSRMAHYFGWHLYGSELNPDRLAITLRWLTGQGYAVTEL